MSFFEWAMLFLIIGLLYFVSTGRLSLPIHWENDYSKIVLLIAILFLYNNISLILIVFLLLAMIYMKSTPEQKAAFLQSFKYIVQTPPNKWFSQVKGAETFISGQDLDGFIHEMMESPDLDQDVEVKQSEIAKVDPPLYSIVSEENVDDIAMKKRLSDIFDQLNH